ncbi:MAG: hypothetical protein ABJ246_20385 [Paracoccaceae bacterium]
MQREVILLGKGLYPNNTAELAELVRKTNCYYSNLIEVHNTKPRDTERALVGAKLKEGTRTHVIVQRKINQMHRKGTLPHPTSIEFLI